MLQQNRFCGILLKKPALSAQLPHSFVQKRENYYVQSDHEKLSDGFKYKGGGAWVEAKWDRDILQLERDRVGVRTIYYANTYEYFVFANTLSLLKTIPFISVQPDHPAVLRFFLTGKTNGLLQDIHELEPGGTLSYDLNNNEITVAEPDLLAENRDHGTEEEIIHQQRNHILDAVKEVCQQTETLGTWLSGGVDSSVIAAATKVLDAEVAPITAVTGDKALNEDQYAGDVVGKLGLGEWHQVLTGNIGLEIENLHMAMELPTTSLGSFMQYELMRFCKHKGITNVLDGTGADALYAGHHYHKAVYWNELLRKKDYTKFRLEIAHPPTEMGWMKYYAKNMMIYYYIPRFRVASKLRFYLRNNPILEGLQSDLIYDNLAVMEEKPVHNLKSLNVFLEEQFYNGPVTELLRFTDRMGKYFGVMNHPVFCQHPALYQTALSIPSSYKIDRGVSKSVLRRAFSTVLPESVVYRKDKKGLVAPNNQWMKEHKNLLLSFVTDDLAPYFKVAEMRDRLAKSIDQSDEQEDYKIFRFLSFAIWHKVWVQ